MKFPKAWDRGNIWAECPECRYILRPQEEHHCKDMVYRISFMIQAWEEPPKKGQGHA